MNRAIADVSQLTDEEDPTLARGLRSPGTAPARW